MQPRGIWGISRDFSRLSPCGGQVAYALLTRAPVAGRSVAAPPLPLDLHVLSLPLAFILSQDQTLRCCYMFFHFFLSGCRRSAPRLPIREWRAPEPFPAESTRGSPGKRGLPAFLAILFVSSHDVNVPSPLPKKGRDCKVSKKEAPVQLPRGIFFRQGPKKSAFRRLRLHRYCPQPILSKFYPNFF